MPSENPFSESFPEERKHETFQPLSQTSGQQLLKVLMAIGIAAVLCCGGLMTLAYWGIQRVVTPDTGLELPIRRESAFATDARKFNEALETLPNESEFPPAVRKLVDETVAALNAGEELPFDRDMFIEATVASHLSGGSLGFVERMSLRNWLQLYEPVPTNAIAHYRILNVRLDSNRRLGCVDLLVYFEDQQAESQQWFLVKRDDGWKFYDWQQLEYGRRMSDEYAAYVLGSELISTGFDDAMKKLNEASNEWDNGNQDRARRLVKACEDMRMLPEDRDEGSLQIVYMWMSFGDYGEAIRVAKRIKSPDKMWGVWPIVGACHLYQENYDEALVAAQRAQTQSPNHPNVHSLFASIYSYQERYNEAANASVQAMKLCPQDNQLWNDIVDYGRTEDLPLLLDLLRHDDEVSGWPVLLSEADSSTTWATALLEEIGQRDDIPPGVVDLAQGSLAWSKSEFDAAAEFYLKGKELATDALVKTRATNDYLWARLQEDKFDELFDESDDLNATLIALVERAYDDEMYGDPMTLLESLQKHEAVNRSPWAAGLRGWVHYSLAEYADALVEFEKFLMSTRKNAEMLAEDQDWLVDTTEYYVSDTLLELDRPLEVVQRWPEDISRHEQAGSHLLMTRNKSVIDEFLKQTADTTISSLRIQRLRLQAASAMRTGGGHQCDLLHQQAIKLARDTYDEDDSFWLNRLITERAENLAWNRVAVETVSLDVQNQPQREQLIAAAIREAAKLCDAELVSRWIQRSQEVGIRESDTYAEIQATLGSFRLSQGDMTGALEALRSRLRLIDEDELWRYNECRNDLLAALIDAKKWDEASELVDGTESHATEVPPSALIDLAKGDETTLRSKMEQPDKETVTIWLSGREVKPYLVRHAAEPWLFELLKEFPAAMQFQSPADHGELLLEQDSEINEQSIHAILNQALKDTFTLTTVPSLGTKGETEMWLATSRSGQRLLLSRSICQYQVDELSEPLASELSQPSLRLTVEILDHLASATQRLFQVAAAFSERKAISFSWSRDSYTWTGPMLKEQLQWQGRVPVSHQVAPLTLTLDTGDDTADTEITEIEEWQSRLEEAGGPIPIIVTQMTRYCHERIRAELVDVDVDEYEITVRPKSDSVINPLVKTGISCTVGPADIRLLSESD
ncbi:MAG: hypothetical protein H8E66_03170 [Planctomycetes bacterium]|nr:hypothetical protein [Planctomycetota bacterium]